MAALQLPWVFGVVVAALAATANPSLGQTTGEGEWRPSTPVQLAEQTLVAPQRPSEPHPLDLPGRRAELEAWTREYVRWKEWADQWWGRAQPGVFDGYQARRRKPDPPVWLCDACRGFADAESPLADACALLADWQEDYATTRGRQRFLRQSETPPKTRWWNHVHLDALWVSPSAGTAYGVVGMHATLKVVGRWQIFVAPGALLVNVPTSEGTRSWQPATDLGMSYRLLDLRVPGIDRQSTLHLNLARAWILGGPGSFSGRTLDLAGFSLTFK